MATPNDIPTDDSVVEHDEIDAALFWHENKKNILLGIAAVVVVVGGSLAWYVSSNLSHRAAEDALAAAGDAPAYESLVKSYRGTMPAADALLLLASSLRDAGKTDESTAAFEKFLSDFPNHPLAGGALFGIGQNQDAAGKSSEAAATYQRVAEKFPASYAAPFARYSQAEILLREFRRDEARPVLEALRTEFPDSPLARVASAQLDRLGQQ